MRKSRIAAFGMTIALCVVGFGGANVEGAVAGPTTTAPIDAGLVSSCVQQDSSGSQFWLGTQSSDEAKLGDELSSIADANQAEVSGVSMCSDYSGAVIYVAQPSAALLASIAAVQARYPALPVTVQTVATGLTDQLAAMRRVIAKFGSILVRIGPKPETGGLSVDFRGTLARSADTPTSRQQILDAATSSGAVHMPVTFGQGSGSTPAYTRWNDAASWFGGDEISNAGGRCSSGIAINVNGKNTMLTAGHCGGAGWTNNGTFFGDQYTTAYPGNADIYGDWKLLYKSQYTHWLYSGAMASSASLIVSSINWGTKAKGSQLCTSGSTTASICRYYITDVNQTVFDGTTYAWPETFTYHSSGQNGIRDNQGFKEGDSGGPCYYSDGSGGVVVAGIVEGFTSGTAPTYVCTQLSGLRAWNPGAALG